MTGNIEQKATLDETYEYAYDLLQRLTEAKSEDETEGWEYDPNGNRTSDNLNPGDWGYDLNDRLLESPNVSYGYDKAGHTVSKTEDGVTTSYVYNAEGRLSRIEDASGTVIAEYSYDPLGRRFKKVTQSETLYFYYADEGLVGEFDATGASVRQYGYVPDSTWTTDPLYQKTSQGYAYYQNDHLGMSRGLIRKTGSKVWKGEYRAFGELKSESGTWGNRLRFPGQYYDEETGNYYNYFRDYDPTTGRYLQSDPTGLAGGINAYVYVGSNPFKYIDPFGLTRYDVQVAIEIIRDSQLDLDVPVDVSFEPLPEGVDGVTSIIDGDISLDDAFLGPLNDGQAQYMLETVMHEIIHHNQSPFGRWWDGNIDTDHYDVYDEARRQITKELIDELNRRRKQNNCEN
jgi:RHS repeat-associated protein